MSSSGGIAELHRNSSNWGKVVDEIVKLERKIFPKHESLARSFDDEMRKKNSGLLYVEVDGEVVAYVMYSWPSSLYASITKLAGSQPLFLLSILRSFHSIKFDNFNILFLLSIGSVLWIWNWWPLEAHMLKLSEIHDFYPCLNSWSAKVLCPLLWGCELVKLQICLSPIWWKYQNRIKAKIHCWSLNLAHVQFYFLANLKWLLVIPKNLRWSVLAPNKLKVIAFSSCEVMMCQFLIWPHHLSTKTNHYKL